MYKPSDHDSTEEPEMSDSIIRLTAPDESSIRAQFGNSNNRIITPLFLPCSNFHFYWYLNTS